MLALGASGGGWMEGLTQSYRKRQEERKGRRRPTVKNQGWLFLLGRRFQKKWLKREEANKENESPAEQWIKIKGNKLN